MNFGSGESHAKVWRDIWGSGQGIGAVKQMEPVAAFVERVAQEYADIRQRLALAPAGHSNRALAGDSMIKVR
jgi:nitronate monooxygenase